MENSPLIADVCVIMPTYNRAQYIAEAIRSILDQSMPPAELIIVDDGSTDDTASVVAEFGDRVTYLKKENGGKPSAVNLALKHATASAILIADDDDIVLPGALERLTTELAADPNFDFVQGGYYYFVETPAGYSEVPGKSILQTAPGHHFESLLSGFTMSLNTLLIRRQCYEELGGFDLEFIRSQDYEFMLRMTCQYRGRSIPDWIISVRLHEDARGDSKTRHDFADRFAVHFEFNKKAFCKVRRDAPLNAYVGMVDGDLTPEKQLRAWIARTLCMARVGLWEECREDLNTCLAHGLNGDMQLSIEELRTMSLVFSSLPAIEAQRHTVPGYPFRVARPLIRAFGRPAARAFARGFYWGALEAKQDGRYWLALIYLRFAGEIILKTFAFR